MGTGTTIVIIWSVWLLLWLLFSDKIREARDAAQPERWGAVSEVEEVRQ